MNWLCVHLPRLAIDTLRHGGLTRGSPAAVVASRGSQRWIHAADDGATAAGVQDGMALATAYALAPALRTFPRNPAAEQRALRHVALAAYRFSDRLALFKPDAVVLEVRRSRRLLQGVDLRRELRRLGYRMGFAAAPTPHAALLLARSRRYRSVRSLHALDALPLVHSELDAASITTLAGSGIRTVADLRGLPRDGLSRRFGAELPAYLDRLLGRRPDPLPWFEPPERFESTIELTEETGDARALVFTARRLLGELELFLEARGLAVQQLVFELDLSDGVRTRLTIGLLEPGRDRRRLLELVRERIDQTRLAAPARRVTLRVSEVCELEARNGDLFDDPPGEDRHGWARLLERLRSRLGDDAVCAVEQVADHRPERAWRLRPAHRTGSPGAAPARCARPVWLLPEPRSVQAADLTVLGGPERIESGWWDDADVARDYYRATRADGQHLWVFRECREPRQWFTHGLFG